MFAGAKITIDGEEYVVPPLSLGQLRNGMLIKLREHDEMLNSGKIFDLMTLRGEIILAALRRNYPDFAEERLFAFLDMGNTQSIWLSILGASGFQPGEAPAAATAILGT
jgi:hypothetical protein